MSRTHRMHRQQRISLCHINLSLQLAVSVGDAISYNLFQPWCILCFYLEITTNPNIWFLTLLSPTPKISFRLQIFCSHFPSQHSHLDTAVSPNVLKLPPWLVIVSITKADMTWQMQRHGAFKENKVGNNFTGASWGIHMLVFLVCIFFFHYCARKDETRDPSLLRSENKIPVLFSVPNRLMLIPMPNSRWGCYMLLIFSLQQQLAITVFRIFYQNDNGQRPGEQNLIIQTRVWCCWCCPKMGATVWRQMDLFSPSLYSL